MALAVLSVLAYLYISLSVLTFLTDEVDLFSSGFGKLHPFAASVVAAVLALLWPLAIIFGFIANALEDS